MGQVVLEAAIALSGNRVCVVLL